ncbi:hypothetical protein [Saccharothrix variisporea]|uniref:Uncharacterized protein n=1 Tax=Saccharothrix variisporea TaxID=543527 RepID=A0A495X4M7_9PSEU|nr:hypothetical protein [Saccharothrix variisporea]RKT68469.1 hypothetical protein DFJ66_1654 [Saccharothrix variisporea]
MIVWLVVNGIGPGLHRLVVGTRSGRPEQVVVGEVGRVDPERLALADVLVDPGQGRSRSARRALVVLAFGFPVAAKNSCAAS